MTQNGNRIGALLGLINTLFIAVAFSVSSGMREWYWLTLVIVLFGILPGVLTGMLLGTIAVRLAHRHAIVRCAVLVVPAVAALLGCAAMFGLASRFALGVIPTIVCALILERATRARSQLPAAIVN